MSQLVWDSRSIKDLLRVYGIVFGVVIITIPFLLLLLAISEGEIEYILILAIAFIPALIIGGFIVNMLLQRKGFLFTKFRTTYQYFYNPYHYWDPRQPQYILRPVTYVLPSNPNEPLYLPDYRHLLFIFLIAIIVGTVAFIGNFILVFILCFIIGFSFPSLVWVSYIYNVESSYLLPGRLVLIALTWGMLSPIVVLVISLPFMGFNEVIQSAVVAPFVEEFAKFIGLIYLRKDMKNPTDGLIYGVSSGVGFAMVENLFYEASFISGMSVITWSIGTAIRGLTGIVVHAAGTGLLGLAYAVYLTHPNYKKNISMVVLTYFLSVGIHAGWNGTLVLLSGIEGEISVGTLIFTFAYPIFIFMVLRKIWRKFKFIYIDIRGGAPPGRSY